MLRRDCIGISYCIAGTNAIFCCLKDPSPVVDAVLRGFRGAADSFQHKFSIGIASSSVWLPFVTEQLRVTVAAGD